MTLTDTQGRIISKRNLYDNVTEIAINDLPAGMYFVQITQGSENTILKLIIIQ
jgi:hypothetical protein